MIKKAFTLIELLIVVAIIAILAAIAVPNFLEAQTRSKVSRVKADMRTIGVGCESYRVDNTHMFPVYRYVDREIDYSTFGDVCQYWWLYILWDTGDTGIHNEPNPGGMGGWITSPVQYLASIPRDPFSSVMLRSFAMERFGAGILEASVLYYGPENSGIFGWPLDLNTGNAVAIDAQYPDAGYGLFSCGPDLILDVVPEANQMITCPVYDPTNGTTSAGDIVYLGRGIGFPSSLR